MKEKAMSIRLEESMYNQIVKVAREEGRTLNSQIKQFLIKGIARHLKEMDYLKSLDENQENEVDSTINQQENVG